MPGGWRWRRGAGHRGEPQPRQIRGFIEPALLLLISRGATHGYELLSGLQKIGFDQYPVDPSTAYRVLRNLEAEGMIFSHWETQETSGPPRRVYQITQDGQAYLASWVADLRATDRILHRFLQAYDEESDQRS